MLIGQINQWEIEKVLSVEKPDQNIARQQFRIYLEREQYSDCREVLQYIPNETEQMTKKVAN